MSKKLIAPDAVIIKSAFWRWEFNQIIVRRAARSATARISKLRGGKGREDRVPSRHAALYREIVWLAAEGEGPNYARVFGSAGRERTRDCGDTMQRRGWWFEVEAFFFFFFEK